MIAKFRYDSENMRHSEKLCTVIFSMIANFRYHSEKLCIANFSQGLRNFRYGCEIFAILAKFSLCHSENPALPGLPHALVQPPFLQFHLTFLYPWLRKSPRICINQHRYEAKLEMKVEVFKTCKTTKNNLETKSVVLNGSAHVNWLNSYD